MVEFQPFEYLMHAGKQKTLEEKADALADAIQVVLVNLMQMSEFNDSKFADVINTINQINARMDALENRIGLIEQKLQLPGKEIIKPPPPPPQKTLKTTSNDVRGAIMEELEKVFKAKSTAESDT
jgi:hypothetical protein